jgi:uncharacterized protein YeaO (DUF488 family)
MIKTKSVYDPVDLESDGFRVLVMRKWPRGIGYQKHAIHKWIKEVGPSRELLRRWNSSEITWKDYVKQYCAQQTSSIAARIETDYIARTSIDKTVTLLCKERENDPHCHRHILSKTIDEIVNQINARQAT